MFSMVMMAALAGPGAEAPAFFFRKHGCHGCWSCGGCYGCHGCWGCAGCYGCYGCHGYARVSYGCYGCTGCTGCYGCYAAPVYPVYYQPVVPSRPEALPAPAPKEKPQSQAANRARLIVELPSDAKLFIDDQPTRAAGINRTIATPELQAGEEYYYLLRAEATREGKPITETQRVTFRAGSEIRVAFPNLPAETTTAASNGR